MGWVSNSLAGEHRWYSPRSASALE